MVDLEVLFSQGFSSYQANRYECEPLTIDKWLASSALQKAIRRGNEAEALSCARLLLNVDAQRLWRRLGIIAIEDIGVADIEVVGQTLWASRSKARRSAYGDEWHVASYLVGSLCRALKSRDTDDLASIADRHPDLAEYRMELVCAPTSVLCDVLADPNQQLPARALAGWFLGGTTKFWAPYLPERPGNIGDVIDVYRHVGMPEYLLSIVEAGAAKERGALPINLGLLWLHLTAVGAACGADGDVEDVRPVSLGKINGVSSEAYDMHTRSGKRSIAYFVKACSPVRDYLSRYVPDQALYGLVSSIVFRVESARVDRRLDYEGSDEIQAMANVAEVVHHGFPADRVVEALEIVCRHLPDLHRARLRVVER